MVQAYWLSWRHKTDFLLSILEIGTFPKNYQKNFPYPERKYFWYKITQKFQIYDQKIFQKIKIRNSENLEYLSRGGYFPYL